jgi:hypothetical protein
MPTETPPIHAVVQVVLCSILSATRNGNLAVAVGQSQRMWYSILVSGSLRVAGAFTSTWFWCYLYFF